VPVQIDAASALLPAVVTAAATIVLSIAANLLTPLCQRGIEQARNLRARRSAERARKRILELRADLDSIQVYADSHEAQSTLVTSSLMAALQMLCSLISVSLLAVGTFFALGGFVDRAIVVLFTVLMGLLFIIPVLRLSRAQYVVEKAQNFNDYGDHILASIATLQETAGVDPSEYTSQGAEGPAPAGTGSIPSSPELNIQSAKYGIGDKAIDVTAALKRYLRENRLEITVNNELLGGDPAKGELKELRVVYSYRGKTRSAVIPEYEDLSLPPPE